MTRRVGSSIFAVSMFFSALLPLSAGAQSVSLDFDTDANGNNIQHGQVIDNEYAGFGVDIWADNADNNVDLAVAYKSAGRVRNNRDPDLRSPWDGGNAWDTEAGNLLIIQENKYKCGDGVCNRPDDEGSRPAGSIFFDFNQQIESVSFDLIDIERPEQSGAYLTFLDSGRNEINSGARISFDSLAASDSSIAWGDNFYNSISTILIAPVLDALQITTEVFGLEFFMGGSGALNNVTASYHSVPEIDAASGSIALALLAGFIALMRERKKTFGQSFAA